MNILPYVCSVTLVDLSVGCQTQERADEWKGEEGEKQRRLSAWKGKTFMFRSYDPLVTQSG